MSGIADRIGEAIGEDRIGEHAALPGIPLAQPREDGECAELFRLAARDSLAVLPLGLGSKLDWTRPARGADYFLLSTAKLAGVVEFEAGDGTITARAGTTIATLRETVAGAGLELTPDVPRPAEATLGGVIAAGQSGPDRLAHGPTRGHLLGTRTMLASGEVTRSGGRLVKNATGYDLHRLYCGSCGTLGLILEVSMRLLPAPRAIGSLSAGFDDLSEALSAAIRLRKTGIEVRSMTVENQLTGERAAPWGLHVTLVGFPEPVEKKLDRLAGELSETTRLEGEAARALADRVRDQEPDARSTDLLRLAAPPSRLVQAAARLFERLGDPKSDPIVVQPGVAMLDLGLILGDPGSAAARVSSLREELVPLASRLLVRGPALRTVPLDPFGCSETSFPLQRRLRDALDPGHLLAEGRFHGGL